ncbi:MAG: hypothetical protein KAI47_03550 [Deltaproteobacteria bacterium]|nr:hypothetical protein [Deltaproteobacteria bacterium]
MSERDYREAIAAVLADIERKSRKVGRHVGHHAKKVILPATLGAGLALGLGGCGDDTSTKPIVPMADAAYGAPPFDMGPQPDSKTKTDVKADTIVAGPDAAYGVPFDLPKQSDASANDAGSDTK